MTATTSLAQALSAQDIIRHYDLMPHVEGGHYRRVWCSSQDLQPESLPCGIYGSRPCSTSILYLLQAGAHACTASARMSYGISIWAALCACTA